MLLRALSLCKMVDYAPPMHTVQRTDADLLKLVSEHKLHSVVCARACAPAAMQKISSTIFDKAEHGPTASPLAYIVRVPGSELCQLQQRFNDST